MSDASRSAYRGLAALAGSLVWVGTALAQTAPSQAPMQPTAPPQGTTDELEPAVDTSAQPVASPLSATDSAPAATSLTTSSAAAPAATAPRAARPQQRAAEPAARGRVIDRIELDTTQITGNRELPKVLYIVPWKRSDLGDLGGRPVNSLLDEVLQPVDRDVFRRENRYYEAVKPDQPTGQSGSGSPPGSQPEK